MTTLGLYFFSIGLTHCLIAVADLPKYTLGSTSFGKSNSCCSCREAPFLARLWHTTIPSFSCSFLNSATR